MEGSNPVSDGHVHSAKAHPSARHRRSRKKHGAAVKGSEVHEDHQKRGSSEENSSDDDHHAKEGTEHKAPFKSSKGSKRLEPSIMSDESISSTGIETHSSGNGVNDSIILPTVGSSKVYVNESSVDAKEELGPRKETSIPEEEIGTDANDATDRIDQVARLETTGSSSNATIESTITDLDNSHIVTKENLVVHELGTPGFPVEGAICEGSLKHSPDVVDKNAISESDDLLHKETNLEKENARDDSPTRSEETIALKNEDATTSRYSVEQGLPVTENVIIKDLPRSDSKPPLSGTIIVESVIESEGTTENNQHIGENSSIMSSVDVHEQNIQIYKDTAKNEIVPVSFMSHVIESQFGLVEQKTVFKASSMRCDSLDTDAYEDAPDTLETCSIGGSIDDFDAYQSFSDSSIGQEGVLKENSEDNLPVKPLGSVETLPTVVSRIEDSKSSPPEALQQDLSVLHIESPEKNKNNEVKGEAEEMKAQKSTDADFKQEDASIKQEDVSLKQEDASVKQEDVSVKQEDASVKQEDGHGTALQALLAKDKLEKTNEPVRNSIASGSMDSDANLKPKAKPFWAHCLCCSTVP